MRIHASLNAAAINRCSPPPHQLWIVSNVIVHLYTVFYIKFTRKKKALHLGYMDVMADLEFAAWT